MSSSFVTPLNNKRVSKLQAETPSRGKFDSPFVVPPSPHMKRLGCGTFVTIYRYKRATGASGAYSPWAIKKASREKARRHIFERLKTEGEILRTLNHPNIVVFKKLTTTNKGDVCLSMEDCGKGLDDVIFKCSENEKLFTREEIMKVAWGVAQALDYLHNEKKLLHGDIKSGNVLVKNNFEQVKLCDFGVSIFLQDDLLGPRDSNATYVGSEPWHSREIIDANYISDKADIFAYGLVIWEMITLDVPHTALMSCQDSEVESMDGSFSDASTDSCEIPQAYYEALGTRPPLPEDIDYDSSYDYVIGTFICCTSEDYTERPSARTLVENISLVLSDCENKENYCQNADDEK